jgi:hypothetical protein
MAGCHKNLWISTLSLLLDIPLALVWTRAVTDTTHITHFCCTLPPCFTYYQGCSASKVPYVMKVQWEVIIPLNVTHLLQQSIIILQHNPSELLCVCPILPQVQKLCRELSTIHKQPLLLPTHCAINDLPNHLSASQNLFLHSSFVHFQPLCARITGAITITDVCWTILCLSAPFCAALISPYTVTAHLYQLAVNFREGNVTPINTCCMLPLLQTPPSAKKNMLD